MRAGLGELYPRLWRFCLVLTGERPAADDLAQKTCLRGLDQAHRFTPGSHLDRWLFTIARRLWLNELRAAKVRQGAGLVLVDETDLPDHKPDADVNIFAREVFDTVQALPDGQRLAVLLVYVEGYSYRDAAGMLEIPIGTVMSRLATARRTIASRLGETESEGR